MSDAAPPVPVPPAPAMPERMTHLPRTVGGLPVPYFVATVDGRPDFRIFDRDKFKRAIKQHLCWLCGSALGRHLVFVVGPMCLVNCISSEPPSHLACAEYAVRRCPFLTNPEATRREERLPTGAGMAGLPLLRNPGVSVLWVTRSYKLAHLDNGVLFEMGQPSAVTWWTKGRRARRDEAYTALMDGLPALRALAEPEGEPSVVLLDKDIGEAMMLLPESLA